jgi:RNA polymerase sigma-70 factor, ECF subfamily
MSDELDPASGQALQLAKGGCQDSLGTLLETYRPWLQRLAGKAIDSWLRPRLAASDVVQGSLLRATQSFEQFQGTTVAEFKSWLHTLFANYLVDRQREVLAQKRNLGPEQQATDSDVANELSPSRIAASREDAARMLEAISELDDEQRSIVQLRYLDALSFEEIGEQLGLSRHVVSRRWVEALEAIARQLPEQPDQ